MFIKYAAVIVYALCSISCINAMTAMVEHYNSMNLGKTVLGGELEAVKSLLRNSDVSMIEKEHAFLAITGNWFAKQIGWTDEYITAVVEELVDNGVDPNIKGGKFNFKFETALSRAVFGGNLAVVTALVNHGATIDHDVLCLAALRGQKQIISFFIEKGMSLDDRGSGTVNTLHALVYNALLGLMSYQKDGEATEYEQAMHKLNMALWLIERGARVDIKDASGETVLDFAENPVMYSIRPDIAQAIKAQIAAK